MPFISRPDGAQLYWEERGEGPDVVVANQFFSPVSVFAGLMDLLAEGHRLISYDPRGIGRSSEHGPYDMSTDAEDLAAVIEEACEGPVLIAATGDGTNRAVHVGSRRPDLVHAIVCFSGNPVGRIAGEGGDGLAASDSVIEALLSMMETDYRSTLHTMISTANPNLDPDAVRERVTSSAERCPREAAAPRLRAWVEDEALAEARGLSDKLWILDDGANPWFPAQMTRTAELLPKARIHPVENGAISRPDIAASYIGSITGVDDPLISRTAER